MAVKFGSPKVLLLKLEVPAIPVGETKEIQWKGKRLSESTIANSLPVLGVVISNNSTNDIRVLFNLMRETSLEVVGGATQAVAGYPITEIEIENMGSTGISENEIRLNIINDTIECLRFEQAKAMGVVPYR